MKATVFLILAISFSVLAGKLPLENDDESKSIVSRQLNQNLLVSSQNLQSLVNTIVKPLVEEAIIEEPILPVRPLNQINLINQIQVNPNILQNLQLLEVTQAAPTQPPPQFSDDDRYCCKIDYPIITTTVYKTTVYTYQGSETYHSGYQDCGLFGWSNCAVYSTRYFTSYASRIDAITTYKTGICPVEFNVCCNGFVNVGPWCLHLETELVGRK